MQHDPEVHAAVAAYQLGLPRSPVAGRSGELLGRSTGSSLEFQEHREYFPGDDVRHIDWAAYGRSDTLMLRMYREEISPRMEVLVDVSRSMTTMAPVAIDGPPPKPWLTKQLAAVFSLLAAQLGGRPQIIPLEAARPLKTWGVMELPELAEHPMSEECTLADLLADHVIPPARRAVRVVISDFLFPHDPDPVIRRLAADTSALWVIQVLNRWEADPTPLGGRHLIDAESGAETDIVLDEETVAAYRERLARLQAEISQSCRRVQAPFVTLLADDGLAGVCRKELCGAELLRPM